MIKLPEAEWARIHQRIVSDPKLFMCIAQEYPPSYLLIRDVMRRELGFTSRRHTKWEAGLVGTFPLDYNNSVIYLDFYDDAQETWFRLKYL